MGGLVHWLMVDVIGTILNWLHIYALAEWLGSPGVLNIVTILVVALIILIVGMLVSITLIWQERKMLGRFMDRVGTQVGPFGLFQNFADAFKVLVKEYIVPNAADRLIYPLAPILIIGVSMAMFVTIPYSQGFYMSNSSLSLILTLALFGVIPFAVLLGGWASNNKYTLIGGMRAAAQTCAYEVPMLLSVASVVVLTGSMSLTEIVTYQQENLWLIIPLIIGFFVFLISMISEIERVPFDLPEAEAELVEGWGTEYGGMRFGLIMMSEYARAFVGSSLIALLFLGGWDGLLPEFIPAGLWFLLKVLLVFTIFIWARAALPRVRTDQILNICWKRLLPLAAINLFIAVFFKSMGWF
ncbi:MAG TPA: NADH-quinone oxidoreductase subunit NuoH [Methanomassiliicoccaceae archaeon]|nr:NADH-quinone oxidoreductase subunit NuoH [Methanomassiliicoccaceae archaeon]